MLILWVLLVGLASFGFVLMNNALIHVSAKII